MSDYKPMRIPGMPEVIGFVKPTKFVYSEEGLYRLRWYGEKVLVEKPKKWYHTLFRLEPGKTFIEYEDRVAEFYYDGATEIRTYPELVELQWASQAHTEVYKAIDRYHLRRKLGLDHPFDFLKEEEDLGVPGENTVNTSEYR